MRVCLCTCKWLDFHSTPALTRTSRSRALLFIHSAARAHLQSARYTKPTAAEAEKFATVNTLCGEITHSRPLSNLLARQLYANFKKRPFNMRFLCSQNKRVV